MKRKFGLGVSVILIVFTAVLVPLVFIENSASASNSMQDAPQTPIPAALGEIIEGVLDIQILPGGKITAEFKIGDPKPFPTRVISPTLPPICYGGPCEVVVDAENNRILYPLTEDSQHLQLPLVTSREQADAMIRAFESAQWNYDDKDFHTYLDATSPATSGMNWFRSPSLPLKYGQPIDDTSFSNFWNGITPTSIDIFSGTIEISYVDPGNPLPWTPVPCYYPCCFASGLLGANVCEPVGPVLRLDWLGDWLRQIAPPD